MCTGSTVCEHRHHSNNRIIVIDRCYINKHQQIKRVWVSKITEVLFMSFIWLVNYWTLHTRLCMPNQALSNWHPFAKNTHTICAWCNCSVNTVQFGLSGVVTATAEMHNLWYFIDTIWTSVKFSFSVFPYVYRNYFSFILPTFYPLQLNQEDYVVRHTT